MHREQAMLENAQSHLYEGTRQNMLVIKHNNVDQTFWIFYFLCVFGFLTQKQEKIDQKQCKNIQSKEQTSTIFNTCWNDNKKHTTNQNHKA